MKLALSLASLLALTTLSAGASASAAYPALVQQYFGIDTLPAPPPGCTLCHSTDQGGNDTVVRPFGRSLLGLGVVGSDAAGLEGALSQLESEGIDSDRDDVSDAAELRAGEDPNAGSSAMPDPLSDVPLPQTGCSLARGPSPSAAALGLVLAALLGTRRPRRVARRAARP